MSTPDFRDEEPVWVKYAEYIGGGSNKFYEVRVDMGDDGTFYLQKRWGARPDSGAGQIKVEPYQSLNAATNNANAILKGKLDKGYRLTDRPLGASNKVAKEYGNDYYSDEEAF
jgi:predicted DNA-binding WGR domain protein